MVSLEICPPTVPMLVSKAQHTLAIDELRVRLGGRYHRKGLVRCPPKIHIFRDLMINANTHSIELNQQLVPCLKKLNSLRKLMSLTKQVTHTPLININPLFKSALSKEDMPGRQECVCLSWEVTLSAVSMTTHSKSYRPARFSSVSSPEVQ